MAPCPASRPACRRHESPLSSPALGSGRHPACCRRGPDSDEETRSRRVQAVRRQIAKDTTRYDENKPAAQIQLTTRPPQARVPGQDKSGFSPFVILSEPANQFDIPSTRRASPQPVPTTVATSFAPLTSGFWLGTARRTIGAACRDGGGSAGSRHAAQTVWSEAASPSPTNQDRPGVLGKRTTQALVAQGIEHRFPKALAVRCRRSLITPPQPAKTPVMQGKASIANPPASARTSVTICHCQAPSATVRGTDAA
jgi:hypothetical protein